MRLSGKIRYNNIVHVMPDQCSRSSFVIASDTEQSFFDTLHANTAAKSTISILSRSK